ncbi:hypothetical protein F7725_006465 [Dissostichus mawsoni]|uniref:RCC1 like n=1 Tax=Dissostichus mawsoni TaxID=36200 RepID=A0A7J5XUY2_DISMA|nr:hypothetical protein F7725_006465 [Dissostichus mawsoni]
MALPCVRLCSRHVTRGLQVCVSPPARGERSDSGPVFQYVGQNKKPSHKVFVWGFSFTGALGIPSLVVPDSGRKKPRKYQLTPYHLVGCLWLRLHAHRLADQRCDQAVGMGLNKDSQLGFQRTQDSRREFMDNMGNNAYGQCGRPIVEDEWQSHIHRMTGFSSRVTQVACGQDHSLFLTETGTVFACGWGADGQTGLGHHQVSCSPVEVGGDLAGVEVQQISSYGDCSLAVSKDGDLYGWGNSEYLQLASVTEATQMNSPRRLPLKGCGKLVQAACGGTQVAALNDKGEVFVWGYGILGKGPKLSESSTPEMIPSTLFGRSEFNPSVAVTKIRCGLNHFAAVTDRGELFVWGKNVRGCLGTGKRDDQFFPWRVTVPGQVVDVVCGVDHMVALVKSLL